MRLVVVAASVVLAGCSQEAPFSGGVATPGEVMAGQVRKLEELCGANRLTCKVSRHRPIGPYSEVIVGKLAAWGASLDFAILVDRRGAEAFANGNPDPPRLDERIAAKLLGRERCLERNATILCYAGLGGYEDRGRQVVIMEGPTRESGTSTYDGCLGWLLTERLYPDQGSSLPDRPDCRNKRGP